MPDARTKAPHRPRTRRRFALIAILAVGTVTAVAVNVARPARASGASARTELIQSLGLLNAGNFSAARNHAIAATKADPAWGLAHAVLARTYLALGDGVAAEGELGRATDAGFDARRVHQLYAHAWLLQGDSARALAEAGKAEPRFGGYALRIAARAMAAKGDLPGAQATLATVLAADTRNSYGWSDLGRVRYTAGDIAGAIDAATRATDLDRNNVEALVLRGELVRDQYGLLAALPWFEAALKHDAYYHPALIEYAATLGDVGRNIDMLDATRRALAARPGSPQALYLQAVLAARAGNYDLARTLMQKTGGKVDHLPGALLLDGMLEYQGGDFEQAIGTWRELVGRQPFNLDGRRMLGAALLRSGDARGALDVLRPLALRGDADSYTLSLVGRAFERTGERDWAAKYLDRSAWPSLAGTTPFGTDDSLAQLAAASDKTPDDPVARVGYLKGLVDAGNTAGALSQAQALVRTYPGAPAAHLAVGDVLMVMGRFDDAAASYRRAADLRFDEATMLRAVDALDRAHRAAEATNVLSLYLSQNPQSIPAQRLVAHRQMVGGDWDAAIDTLEQVRSRIGNRDVALLSELAYAYTGNDDPDAGVVFAKAAYHLAPMNPAAADSYGWALYQQGKTEPALQLLEKATAIAPDNAMLRWHLGQAQADSGRNALAVGNIRAALADPAFTDRAAAAALLRAL
ncbi:MAG: tetratricopeptide repeat protein [Pseudomonadota bacterium]